MPRLEAHISPAPKRALIYGIIRFRRFYVTCIPDISIARGPDGPACETRARAHEYAAIPGAICRHLKCTNPLSARGQRPPATRCFSTPRARSRSSSGYRSLRLSLRYAGKSADQANVLADKRQAKPAANLNSLIRKRPDPFRLLSSTCVLSAVVAQGFSLPSRAANSVSDVIVRDESLDEGQKRDFVVFF